MHERTQHLIPGSIKWITNQARLAQISMEHRDCWVRDAAVKRVTDQPVLAAVAMMDKNQWVRASAVERITEKRLLVKIAMSSRDYYVQSVAIQRLQDLRTLANLGKKEGADWFAITDLRLQQLVGLLASHRLALQNGGYA